MEKEKEIISYSVDETHILAQEIAKRLWNKSCVLLSGDLGAGKTSLTQGIAKGLGIKRRITSPTFTLQKSYEDGRINLHHFDAYRLENSFQDIGFSEFIEEDGVCVIEWPEYITPLLPKEYLWIDIIILDENKRLLKIKAVGEKYEQLLKEIIC